MTIQTTPNDEFLAAAEIGDLARVQAALAAGADLHVRQDSALCLAAIHGHLLVVQFLIAAGADIHTQQDLPLCWAANSGHLPVVRCLVEAGADIHTNDDGPICSAATYGHIPVVRYLAERIFAPDLWRDRENEIAVAAEKLADKIYRHPRYRTADTAPRRAQAAGLILAVARETENSHLQTLDDVLRAAAHAQAQVRPHHLAHLPKPRPT